MISQRMQVFRNDLILLEVRIGKMRQNKLIKRCPNCMKSLDYQTLCNSCRQQSNFPSAFSSTSEWDNSSSSVIDVPILSSHINLGSLNRKQIDLRGKDGNFAKLKK